MTRWNQPREVLEGGRLKGGMLRSHVSWLNEFHPDRRAELFSHLPAAVATELSGSILASSWYSFSSLILLDRAIDTMFSASQPRVLAELGRYSAKVNLSTTYRMLDRCVHHEFFERSALLHAQFQDFGSVEYRRRDNGGVMIHRGYPCYSVIFCASGVGYYEGTISSHGATHASVKETTCQCYGESACTFEMEWS